MGLEKRSLKGAEKRNLKNEIRWCLKALFAKTTAHKTDKVKDSRV